MTDGSTSDGAAAHVTPPVSNAPAAVPPTGATNTIEIGKSHDPSSPLSSSPVSSSSSFVPVAAVSSAIQLIDEQKQFNAGVLDYISQASAANSGACATAEHRIISVFGSQSTGKSTLLNALFNTNFGVMDEVHRQQTTKGIWLSVSPGVTSESGSGKDADHVIVMDVEGTDGRERGEDQDFERKAALFALATSEVLIVNLWETQVGLYQGANMGLLKTVFEVNLSLFGAAKLGPRTTTSEHKVLLLFVIRDHLGVTPKASLAATVTQDLLKIWDNLNKPAELAALSFHDFFDLAFHTLGHKVLQPEKFMADVKLLGNRFVDARDPEFLFKPAYHHDIPIEGWTMYVENCWDQIDSNKDLDLPTQQILVAKFKCDEIVSACFDEFLEEFAPVQEAAQSDSSETDAEAVGADLSSLRDAAVAVYDSLASKYNQSVYEQRRTVLAEKLNSKLADVVAVHAKRFLDAAIKAFSAGLAKKSKKDSFTETAASLTSAAKLSYATALAHLSLNGDINTNAYAAALEKEVSRIVSNQQIVELNAIVNKHVKKLSSGIKTAIAAEIANPSPSTWDIVLGKLESISKESLERFKEVDGVIDFGVGADERINKVATRALEFQSWQAFQAVIHSFVSKENLLNILKDKFDDKFRYDQNGLPRLYKNSKELEISFADAKEHAMEVFPILTSVKLADGSVVKPKVDVNDKNLRRKYESVNISTDSEGAEEEDADSESEDDSENRPFSEILDEQEKKDVLAKFKREIDAKFVETKRSIIQHITQIPYYIYLVILVLGWNEFTAILRNPFLFTLLLVFAAAVYVMYQTNLLRPALVVGQRMIDESVHIAKQKIREFVDVENDSHARHLKNMGETKESIELDTLDPEAED